MERLVLIEPHKSNITEKIEQFLSNPVRDNHIEFVAKQKSIESVIKFAVVSKDEKGVLHPHQRRIKKDVLSQYLVKLIFIKNEIELASSFDEIYQTLFSSKIKGIGPLSVYDIAVRIAAYKKISPNFIYIHAGVKTNLEKITGSKIKNNKKSISSLPLDFSILTEYQIEILLCDFFKEK